METLLPNQGTYLRADAVTYDFNVEHCLPELCEWYCQSVASGPFWNIVKDLINQGWLPEDYAPGAVVALTYFFIDKPVRLGDFLQPVVTVRAPYKEIVIKVGHSLMIREIWRGEKNWTLGSWS